MKTTLCYEEKRACRVELHRNIFLYKSRSLKLKGLFSYGKQFNY